MKKIISILLLMVNLLLSCQIDHNDAPHTTTEVIETSTLQFVKTLQITGRKELAFAQIDTSSNLYRSPYIIINDKPYAVKGFHSDYGSNAQSISLSPSNRYLIMDYLRINTINKEVERNASNIHSCIVIDLLQKRVIQEIMDGCDGEWNAQEQWISDGKIILSFD